MKILFFVLATLLFATPASVASADTPKTYYAKVMDSNVAFFSSADLSSAVFNLPTSFFVEIYGKEGNFYSVHYLDLDGFVRVGSVVPMDGVPTRKYPVDAEILVKASNGVKLLPSPHLNTAAQAPTIYSQDSGQIAFYGTIKGDSVLSDSDEWIYCKFDNSFGYIYANDCVKSVQPCDEYFNEIQGELFAQSAPDKGLSAAAKTFIILGVSLPCALIIFLLIKPSLSGQTIKTKANKRRRRHGDYFEFDENDLS